MTKPSRGVIALLSCAAVVFAFGLWMSWCYALEVWRPDSDTVSMVALWEGVQRYGWRFISSWAFSPDNWLLSLGPISAVVFELFGARPGLVGVIGWLIFVSSAALSGLLAKRLAGWCAGLALGCVLIFANYSALGWIGYLAHPASHNISMAWGLLALILAHQGVERRQVVPCIGAGLCVFVDALSDPWAVAALGVPLVLASGVIAVVNRRERLGRCAAVLCGTGALALLAAWSHLFRLLPFLPRAQFALTDLPGMVANLTWAARAVGAMANIVPFGDVESRTVGLVDAFAFLAISGAAAVVAVAGLRRASPGRQLVGGVVILSILAVAAAFTVGRWPPSLNVGRFFPNIYFLGSVLVTTVAAEGRGGWRLCFRAVVIAYAALFMVSGLASRPELWLEPRPPADAAETRALADVLAANGLTYGYGPYWGSNALIMDWASSGRVVIRPVSFRSGQVRPRPAGTSSLWYRPEDEPANLKKRFLVVQNDGEECPSVADCVAMATGQFGPPSESLVHKGAMILIWPAPLASRIAP